MIVIALLLASPSIQQLPSQQLPSPNAIAPVPGSHPRHKGVITMPRLISMPQLDRLYPAGPKSRGEQGITRLRCTLGITGRLSACTIEASAGFPELDAAAFEVAALARFQPMLADGKAVEEPVILPVRWALAD